MFQVNFVIWEHHKKLIKFQMLKMKNVGVVYERREAEEKSKFLTKKIG